MNVRSLMLAAVMCLSGGVLAAAEILVKNGDSIAFLGDSITYYGNVYPSGYLHLVIDGLERSGIKAVRIPSGICGHKSNNMLHRLQRDILQKKPTWMTLSCGVNDVWHGAKGVKLEDYKKNVTSIVDQAQKAGIKVMILTATMIGEDANNANNQKLIPYNNFLRQFAKERKLAIADLNAIMQKQIADLKKAGKKPAAGKNYLTVDGVHMAQAGNIMMASGILAAFGIPEKQIREYQKIWVTWPVSTRVNMEFTLTEWNLIIKAARKAHTNPYVYVRKTIIDEAAKAAK